MLLWQYHTRDLCPRRFSHNEVSVMFTPRSVSVFFTQRSLLNIKLPRESQAVKINKWLTQHPVTKDMHLTYKCILLQVPGRQLFKTQVTFDLVYNMHTAHGIQINQLTFLSTYGFNFFVVTLIVCDLIQVQCKSKVQFST